MPVASSIVTAKNVPRHCQIPLGGKVSPVENHCNICRYRCTDVMTFTVRNEPHCWSRFVINGKILLMVLQLLHDQHFLPYYIYIKTILSCMVTDKIYGIYCLCFCISTSWIHNYFAWQRRENNFTVHQGNLSVAALTHNSIAIIYVWNCIWFQSISIVVLLFSSSFVYVCNSIIFLHIYSYSWAML